VATARASMSASPLASRDAAKAPSSRSYRDIVGTEPHSRPSSGEFSPVQKPASGRPLSGEFRLLSRHASSGVDSDSSSASGRSPRPKSKEWVSSPLGSKTKSLRGFFPGSAGKKEHTASLDSLPTEPWSVDSSNPLFSPSASDSAVAEPALSGPLNELKPRGSKIALHDDDDDTKAEPAKPTKLVLARILSSDAEPRSPLLAPDAKLQPPLSTIRTRPRDISMEAKPPVLPNYHAFKTAPKIKEDDDFYVDSGNDEDDDAVSFYAFFKEAKHVPLPSLLAEIERREKSATAPQSPIITPKKKPMPAPHLDSDTPSSPDSPIVNLKKTPKSLKNVLSFRHKS